MDVASLWQFLKERDIGLSSFKSCMNHANVYWLKDVSSSKTVEENKRIIARNMLKVRCKICKTKIT